MNKKNLHQESMKIVGLLVKKKLKQEPIQTIILGGSVARGDETPYSDIDLNFYVNRQDIPKPSRSFYKFKGKYIEETYLPIEDLKSEDILSEQKIIYDKLGNLNKPEFNEKIVRKRFTWEIKRAEIYQKRAETSFKKGDYVTSFNYLYSLESPAFILIHALPSRFNLPFPTFRLLKSLKQIDKENKTNFYKKVEQLYTFRNKDRRAILKDFEKAYMLMNKIKKIETPNLKNLGFFDNLKVKYNLEELKRTFERYPFVYSYRFIIGCLTTWAFNKKIQKSKYGQELKKELFEVLGIAFVDKNLIKQKLELSNKIIKDCKKLKW